MKKNPNCCTRITPSLRAKGLGRTKQKRGIKRIRKGRIGDSQGREPTSTQNIV